jgi:large conductance mechanosensitive channel
MEEIARKTGSRTKTHLVGFSEFLRTQGIIGLAIGLVLGVQVKALVDQLVASFINPILGLVLPGQGDLSSKIFSLSIGAKQADFTYGAFISVLISFIAVAFVIYFLIKGLRLEKLDKKQQ